MEHHEPDGGQDSRRDPVFHPGHHLSADYVGIANEDETKLNVTGYVRVTNDSGELYDNAQTRLVVGKINLVERFADLARRPAPGQPQSGTTIDPAVMANMSRKRAGGKPSSRMGLAGAMKDAMEHLDELKKEQPKQVIKQGLSEYFLFTIEGREDIKDKEPKRLVALKVADVPLECLYKLTDRDGGQGFTKFYRFKNVKLLDEQGKEKTLSAMETLARRRPPNGTGRG